MTDTSTMNAIPPASEVERLATELRSTGHALTSFESLGIPQFRSPAGHVKATVTRAAQREPASRHAMRGLRVFRDTASLASGHALVAPLFAALDPVVSTGDASVAAGFEVSSIISYEQGALLGAHHDYYFDGLIVVVTVCGEREFRVYRPEPADDVFLHVVRGYTLGPGSVMVLNGAANLGHEAECRLGPSLSVVANVASSIGREG